MESIVSNMRPEVIPNVKSLLSGKNPIKFTPKSVVYKILHKNGNRAESKKGVIFYFIDSGDKSCLVKFKYNLRIKTKSQEVIWFKIKNDRLCASKSSDNQYRNVSNKLASLLITFCHVDNGGGKIINAAKRVEKILIKWCRKQGFGNSKSKLIDLLYPDSKHVLDILDIPTIGEVPSFITGAWINCSGYDNFLDRIFGFHGKKLKKILQQKEKKLAGEMLFLGAITKGLVSPDAILRMLEEYGGKKLNFYDIRTVKPKAYRYFLRNFSEKTICKFVAPKQEILEGEMIYISPYTYLKDAAHQFYSWNSDPANEVKIQLPNSNNIEEIHDAISIDFNRLMRDRTNRIDYRKNLEKLKWKDIKTEKYKIYAPKKSKELIEGGSRLGNCLASYIDAHTKQSLIVFVDKDGELVYALEMALGQKEKKIIQFSGKFNSPPQNEDREEILSLLLEK